ncbi:hypothetical protein Ade02nite_20630 [Paractinoplanes deccanensis]|uniref:Uncharacterized protein n=1 Tax=Paractinoplanes deccanensis TaxID=113561 RepID=A0ABQ3Y0A9_9ACTN|nr:hypothetical protein [Actinoplanes deccanensis]GID73422.1 hypothetical protein Ade02nite_20630 [Actinoplanes deccanensis]
MIRPPICQNIFAHLPDNADTFEHACGHQVLELPCGCVIDDHDTEECDGRSVAELEETR